MTTMSSSVTASSFKEKLATAAPLFKVTAWLAEV